jgi:hypothetical protein
MVNQHCLYVEVVVTTSQQFKAAVAGEEES